MKLLSWFRRIFFNNEKALDLSGDKVSEKANRAIRITSAIVVATLKKYSEEAVAFCPWIKDAPSNTALLTAIEFFIFNCFILDVFCHQQQTGDYAREYVMKHAESMLAKLLPREGGWDSNKIAKLYAMRTRLYESHVKKSTDWLGSCLRELLANVSRSSAIGSTHMDAVALSTNPIQDFLNFSAIREDMESYNRIINVRRIHSLALAIKNAPTQVVEV